MKDKPKTTKGNTMSENLVNDLAEVISDHGGNPHDSARDILADFVVLRIGELPEVSRIDSRTVEANGIRYGNIGADVLMDTVRRLLATVRFFEVEAEQKAEAERIERDALLKEAYMLWRAGVSEPMAQWEFELLVHEEELERWLSIARAARSLHAK